MIKFPSQSSFFTIDPCVSNTISSSIQRSNAFLDDLKALGVVERSPSPTPSSQRNPDNMSSQELRQLVRQLQAKRSATIKEDPTPTMKRDPEAAFTDNDNEVVFVKERNVKRRRIEPGDEVIDLS
jgi:hypothetical protein